MLKTISMTAKNTISWLWTDRETTIATVWWCSSAKFNRGLNIADPGRKHHWKFYLKLMSEKKWDRRVGDFVTLSSHSDGLRLILFTTNFRPYANQGNKLFFQHFTCVGNFRLFVENAQRISLSTTFRYSLMFTPDYSLKLEVLKLSSKFSTENSKTNGANII